MKRRKKDIFIVNRKKEIFRKNINKWRDRKAK